MDMDQTTTTLPRRRKRRSPPPRRHVEFATGGVEPSNLDAVSWLPPFVSEDNAKALLRQIRGTLSLLLKLHARSRQIKVHVGICNRPSLGIEVWLSDLLNPIGGHDPVLTRALEHELTEVVEELRAQQIEQEPPPAR
jgi:hypothetical protein